MTYYRFSTFDRNLNVTTVVFNQRALATHVFTDGCAVRRFRGPRDFAEIAPIKFHLIHSVAIS
jgi:hypothetical protein